MLNDNKFIVVENCCIILFHVLIHLFACLLNIFSMYVYSMCVEKINNNNNGIK